MKSLNKAEFNLQVDDLLQRVNHLAFDGYYEGITLVDDFEQFARLHTAFLNQFTAEHTYQMRSAFESLRKAKDHRKKLDHFNDAMNGLQQDIRSMKHNAVPE